VIVERAKERDWPCSLLDNLNDSKERYLAVDVIPNVYYLSSSLIPPGRQILL
jgi:hypothetical protein